MSRRRCWRFSVAKSESAGTVETMSIGVGLEQLAQELDRFGSVAYVLTVSADGRPHAVAVQTVWEGERLGAAVGKSTAANAADRPHISLLWPPFEPGGYSLIVDGDAVVAPADTGIAPA